MPCGCTHITGPPLQAPKQFTLLNGDHRQVITLFDTGEADRVRALLASDISNALIAERLAAYAAALK